MDALLLSRLQFAAATYFHFLLVPLIFVPIVILYQAWVYRLFSDKVREEDLLYDEAH